MRLAVAMLATVLATPAIAQVPVGNAEAGHAIARSWCIDCHVIEATTNQGRDAVPSFLSIARMPSTTALSLQAFLQTTHERMPNFMLTRQEIDDSVAYILTLRR
jgi:mono/diheme cytochrome c family protein